MMKYFLGRLFVLYSVLQCTSIFAQAPVTVEVFSERWVELRAVPDVSVTLYDLSAPEKVKAAYAPKLSGNPVDAKRMAEAYFKTPESKVYVNKMRDAYQGKIKSIKYRLTKFPAIVFNQGRYVIYGSMDVPQAVILYDKFVSQSASNTPSPGGTHDAD